MYKQILYHFKYFFRLSLNILIKCSSKTATDPSDNIIKKLWQHNSCFKFKFTLQADMLTFWHYKTASGKSKEYLTHKKKKKIFSCNICFILGSAFIGIEKSITILYFIFSFSLFYSLNTMTLRDQKLWQR